MAIGPSICGLEALSSSAIAGIGELSTCRDFAGGSPFAEDSGTSYAAPRVAHAAARLLRELPRASANLCRALLVAHARTPPACAELFSGDNDALHRIIGYGLVDRSALYRSPDDCVSLWAAESIGDDQHHFYELPVPGEFWSSGRRERMDHRCPRLLSRGQNDAHRLPRGTDQFQVGAGSVARTKWLAGSSVGGRRARIRADSRGDHREKHHGAGSVQGNGAGLNLDLYRGVPLKKREALVCGRHTQ